jgi:hypothetical protein
MLLETSKAEPIVGHNISYDNSFSKVKNDIFKETVQKHKDKNYKVDEVIHEKPPTLKPKSTKAPMVKPVIKTNDAVA